jgi:hypothetical protein
LLDAALALGDELDPGWRARLVAARGTELMFVADLDQRIALSDEAVRLARASGQPATLLMVLQQRFNAIWAPETLADRRRGATDAAELADAAGHPMARAFAAAWQMAAAMETGDLAESDQHFARFSALAEETGVPFLRWGTVLHASWRAVLAGELDRAEALRDEARDVGQRAHRPEAELVAATQLTGIRWAQGRMAEQVATLAGLIDALPAFDVLLAWHALSLHACGDDGAARRMLTEACVGNAIDARQRNQVYLASVMMWGELAHALEDVDAAALLATLLTPHADQFAFTGNAVYGPVTHTLGLLARTVGDVEAARRHFTEAVRMTSRMPAPFFTERTRAAAAALA